MWHQKSGKFLHSSWNHNRNKVLKEVYKLPNVILKVLQLHFWRQKKCLGRRLLVFLITSYLSWKRVSHCMCMICRSCSHRPLCKFMYAHTQVNGHTSAKSAVVSSTSKVTTSDICELSMTSLFTRLLSNRFHLTNTCYVCFTFFGSHTNRVSTKVSYQNILKY